MASSSELNAICVKWGTKYASEEVNALFKALRKNSNREIRFFCLTDDRTGLDRRIECLALENSALQKRLAEAQPHLRRPGGALRKISAFDPELIPDLNGNLLCMDIDVLVTGPVDAVFDFEEHYVCMPPPFKRKSHIATKGEGSVIRFSPRKHPFLYEEMLLRTEEMIEFSLGSEQRYTSFTAHRYGALRNFPAGWVLSFLRHCRPSKPFNLFIPPALPKDARFVCFPSEPKARQALLGYRKGLKTTLAAPWIADFI